MSDVVKIALIAASALVAAVGLNIYFSPYQSCVRAVSANPADDRQGFAEVACAQVAN